MYECTNCREPVARRGMCPECAEIRRGAGLQARQITERIRVAYGDGLPQHEEVMAPPPMRPAEPRQRTPEPVEVSEVATTAEVAPVASPAVRLATVSVLPPVQTRAPLSPRKGRPMVVAAVVRGGFCRIEGCGCRVRQRGLCDRCAKQARAEGVFEQVAAPIQRYDTDRAVADVVNVATRAPGLTAREIGMMLNRTHHQTRAAAYAAVDAGKLVRKGGGYYLPDVAAKATDAEERQAAIVALVTGKWRTKPEICAELGYDKHEAAYALAALRTSGRLVWDGSPGAGWTAAGGVRPPVRADALGVTVERVIATLRIMPRNRAELCEALSVDAVTLTRAAATRRGRDAIDRSGDKWRLVTP